MTKANLHESNSPKNIENPRKEENNWENIKEESLLLNIDIFSSEYDDEEEVIEEDKIEEKEIVVSQPKDEVISKDSNGLNNQDLEIDNEDSYFTLKIEETIQETDMQRSKRELNQYMRKSPKKRIATNIRQTIKSKDENIQTMVQKPMKVKIDIANYENKTIKKPKPLKSKKNHDFNVFKETTITKIIKTPNKKAIPSKKDQMNIGRYTSHKKPNNGFSMDIDGDKIQEKKTKFSSFTQIDKKSVKKENNLKVEV